MNSEMNPSGIVVIIVVQQLVLERWTGELTFRSDQRSRGDDGARDLFIAASH